MARIKIFVVTIKMRVMSVQGTKQPGEHKEGLLCHFDSPEHWLCLGFSV